MSDKASPWDKAEQNQEAKPEVAQSEANKSAFDPLKLLGEASTALKNFGSKNTDSSGKTGELSFPSPFEKNVVGNANGGGAGADGKAQDKKPDSKQDKAENKQDKNSSPTDKGNKTDNMAVKADVPKSKTDNTAHKTDKPAVKTDNVLSPKDQAIADKVLDRIKDSKDPVSDLKTALGKLDNLKDATVTRNGNSSHVEIHLKHGQTSAPPNISERGFTPVASHTGANLSFDLAHVNGGVSLTNMHGFSASVQGPLGRIRHSETTGIFIGKDSAGVPYVNSSADLYMRRRVYSGNSTLRENQFPADSPMRNLMHQPDALDNVSRAMRMFQNTDDLKKLNIKNNNGNIDVKSESKNDKHVELDFKPKDSVVPITVKSMDLAKDLSASLVQEKNAVTLDKIKGLIVNVEIGPLKMSLAPTKVSLEKDEVKMELTNPKNGEIMPFSIPVSKLKEAAERKK